MIASALRTEIERFYARASVEVFRTDLASCALAVQRLTRGARPGGPEELLPSMRALAVLVERADGSPARLAYCALCEHTVARLGLVGGNLDRVEEALDEIDDLAQDPAELPALRGQLWTFIEHFEQLCMEATDARRRRSDLRVSAA